MKRFLIFLLSILTVAIILQSCGQKWTSEEKGAVTLIYNKKGQTLGYSPSSGVNILTVSRYAFKDLNGNGSLDRYEDWRLPVDDRAADLASKLSVEEIAGLMLYSSHQAIPDLGGRIGRGTYGGKPFSESGASFGALSDQQIRFLTEDNLRHVLITSVQAPAVAAEWNNNAQQLVEGIGHGIPVNISSDPRHGSDIYAEYNAGAGGKISMWPGTLGLTASFDPSLMKQFGEVASREYRALGIATALSPQIDLATEPRWSRFDGTMGEDPRLAADMARAYVDGFQTSEGEFEIAGGWGYHSVNAMVKHWPGGGPEEGGRDGHFGYGAYAIYPGSNLKEHLKPFVDGAFKLSGPTGSASAVMPYYTISFNQDSVNHENVGNSYSKYIINDLLRGIYGFEGVVCTDWGVTSDVQSVDAFAGKCWGAEHLTVEERHYKVIMAGVDQFGGNNDKRPVIAAYNMGVNASGEEFMRKRFEESAIRLLRNIFRVGLFENPYLDISETEKTVGNPDFMKAGYEAQLRSVVMLKNHNKTLPVQKKLKVYIPERHIPGGRNWFGQEIPERWTEAIPPDVASRYFEVTERPKDADIAIVVIENPDGGAGYDNEDLAHGGNGYVPISLQYGSYTADYARQPGIAGGSPFESFIDRSFKGKAVTARNIGDMHLISEIRSVMGDKPVIVFVKASKPMVFSEIEPLADVILVHFGVQVQALLDLVTGMAQPSALLPFQMPANMQIVEEQLEDVPRDMKCYRDVDGNIYDFAFGMNWEGVIDDERVRMYR